MNPAPEHVPPRVILPIQYLRGLAALMVVWFHSVEQVPGVSPYFAAGFGNSGVDLFFVISGFIMVATTLNDAPAPLEFMRRRIVRVVPLYWLLTLAMVTLAMCVPGLFRTLIVAPATLVESLLFIPHFSESFPTMVWPLLVPGWTLNFEMFFYAVFACSLLLPRRARLPVLAVVFATLVGTGMTLGPFDSAAAQVYLSPLLLEFVAGAAIATWWDRRRAMLGTLPSIMLLVLGFALLAYRNMPPLGAFTQMLGAAMMVVGALSPGLSNWRATPLRALGDSSYSLYLTHLFTLGLLRIVWARLIPPIQDRLEAATYLAVALGATSLVGWLVFRFVETPALHWLNARTKSRQARLPIAAAK
jgi:exopolysaccharide production protein ExoZ